MNFFRNKSFLFKLVASLCIILIIFNFCFTTRSQAGALESIGGMLLDPICSLLLAIGSGIMEILQRSIMGSSATTTFDTAEGWVVVLIGLFVAAAVVALCIFVPGAFAVIIAIAKIGFAVLGASGLLTIAVFAVSAVYFDSKVLWPTFTIGPEEIFSGKILLFDPNVFNPRTVYVKYTNWPYEYAITLEEYKSKEKENENDEYNIYIKRVINELVNYSLSTGDVYNWENTNIEQASHISEETFASNIDVLNEYYKSNDDNIAQYFYLKGDATPDQINTEDDEQEYVVYTSMNNSAEELKGTIAKWYYIIRNISIVGLMLVLVYIGIRILLTSAAADKAKYKSMLGDWVVGLCLVFLMQYIMVFSNEFVSSITDIFANIADNNQYSSVIMEPSKKLTDSLTEVGYGEYIKEGNIIWPTNLMGRVLLDAQQKNGTIEYVGYTLCYLVLVIYTLIFSFTYLKRLLYLLFLTVISPLVAMTYPLDKIRDGQAQAFNMWLKEYIYNLLIQPFHLLLYLVFITMAFDIAGTNLIYSLVVIGFMIPAEKFLRNMFGFNKASTPGFLAGGAGAAMVLTGLQKLSSFANKGGNQGKNSANKSNAEKEEQKKIRTADTGNDADSLYQDALAEDSAPLLDDTNGLGTQQDNEQFRCR